MEDAASEVAVADASPLIALYAIDLLGVLCARFREVLIPLSVWNEIAASSTAPEPSAVAALPCVRLVPDSRTVPGEIARLGGGERQALTIAAEAAGRYVLVDDGAARRFARTRGIPHTGTIGLVALAREIGLCELARDRYVALLNRGFRIDRAVVNDVLRDLGETALDER